MKNTIKLFEAMRSIAVIAIIAVIGFSMVSCDNDGGGGGGDDGGSGSLTITGIPAEYNGKYIAAVSEHAKYTLVAAAEINMRNETLKGVKIAGGSVTLKVWEATASTVVESLSILGYSGNDTNVTFNIAITKIENIPMEGEPTSDLLASGQVTVSFTNGVGSGALY